MHSERTKEMNEYGPMKDTMRRVTAYQQCDIKYLPGYGTHFYSIGIEENGQRFFDTFELKNDKDVNAALNVLYHRATSPK